MSFGGGGFGGFGSNNSNQSGFGSGGGFGTNTNSGFGSNANTSSPFGQSNTGGSLFGGNNTTSSPFGGGGGGFGSNTNTSFGSKPFGSGTTGGGLFGNTTTSGSSFGGFGQTANNTSTSGFGASGNTGGGLFGQNKTTGFGSSTTGTGAGGLFGGGSTGGGFGANTTGGFGGSTNTFGANQQQQQQQQQQQPNNGTASTPFNAYQEKDAGGQQQFQTITFQQPYTNYSLEELRVVDYNQGRRHGNQNGQAGAFGQSTGFGGFGASNNTPASTGFGANTNTNTGGGLFGNNANTSTPFGQNNTTTTFGSNTNTTGGGLFGQNKPAGGLFGSTGTSQPASGGGLFGSTNTNTNTGGFGSGGTGFGASTSGGGGLFGQNQTQNKPAFGGFGANTNTNTSTPFGGGSTGGAFGSNNTTGGGLFGQSQTSAAPAFGAGQQTSNTGGGLFGNANNTSSGGLFGQTQNQTQTQQPAGGLFSGFGQNNQNQQKPGGLFGSSTTGTTGGGLFGQNNQQNQPKPGGLFGNTATNTTSGGLFGQSNNQNQQSGGLFGNTQNAPATGGGLFGGLNNSTQQNQGSSLFGGAQQNQQKPGGLFGGSTNTNTGGGLFGGLGQNNNASTLGSSLFAGSQNQQQQPQQSSLNNSLFGASGNSLLQTSMNTNPYGNDALFAGLATPTQSPGPLATPLSSQKNRKSAILPQHKLNPSASTRLLTPQNKRPGGYGFTYSTYGTPNSASSNPSPGFSSSFLGSGSLSRSLGKSLSTSNLRNSYTPETSILAPGAFSTNGRSFATGSLKKLNINRSINTRVPLFDEPSPDKKRVSFAAANGKDSDVTNGTGINGVRGNELILRAEPEEASPSRVPSSGNSSTVNGDAVNGSSSRPEMSQINGNELTPVPENGALASRSSSFLKKQAKPGMDAVQGEYWSRPSLDELRKMSRSELSNIKDFIVGRDGVGQIHFNPEQHYVDLTGVNLDKLYGDIVELTTRNATVYGERCTEPKPAQGSGLNHFSRITLGNSWPRNKAGKKDTKHLQRLKRVYGTDFESFNPDTGEWVFTVPHFSSYGLDYDGEEYSDDEEDDSSELSAPPDTPAGHRSSQMTGTPQEVSPTSPTQSSPDDTFDFKKGKRKRASVPGGYGNEVAYEEDEEADDVMDTTGTDSFLGERSVGSLDGQHDADYTEESESESVEDQDMAGSVSGPVHTTEQPAAKILDPFKDSLMPKSILKHSQVIRPGLGTPSKGTLIFDEDWANQLQRTVSPKKQDRTALRETQGNVLRERENDVNIGQLTNGQEMLTRMDLMESLFPPEKGKGSAAKRAGHGIENPYPKRPKTSRDLDELSASDLEFHSSNKPHFSATGTLVYANKGNNSLESGPYRTVQEPMAGANKDIRFTKLPTFADAVPQTLSTQREHTKVTVQDKVPSAKLITDPASLDFSELAKAVAIDTSAGAHEHKAWALLSLLFDDADEVPSDMTRELFEQHKERYRKDKLSEFWESLVYQDAMRHVQQAGSPEERALAHLSGHNVPDACQSLLNGLDLRLATMVAQIGGDHAMRENMVSQIEEWRRLDVISEMDEAARALYELLSGNCALSRGKSESGLENKANALHIAQRFGLDWRRAFGLRLWYGTLANEPIELAVAQFADALRFKSELVKPIPWFVEEGIDMGFKDSQSENREDLLWGILKLYASSKMELAANIEDVLAPENVSGHPLNARLSFQLFQFFKSRLDDKEEEETRKIGMPTVRDYEGLRQSFMSSTASTADKDDQADDPLIELGDKLALTYAASLHTPDHWTTALFVYAHLFSPAMREYYIRSLLAQYSNTYSLIESDATYKYLVNGLHIPSQWLHAAAALQAKTEGNNVQQTMHLIKAGELDEAHEVLCRSVGPNCIISRDYDALRELLGDFVPTPTNSPTDDGASTSSRSRGRHKKEPVQGWSRGGQIYFDYIELLDLTSHQSSYRVDEQLNNDIHGLLSKLQNALEGVAKDRWEGCGLEERVALTEIAGVVANLIVKNKHPNRARVLKLPLTEDLWLRHSSDLSVSYYKAVMASEK